MGTINDNEIPLPRSLRIGRTTIGLIGRDEIWRLGVTMPPALTINGEVKSGGRMPNRSTVGAWLRQAAGP